MRIICSVWMITALLLTLRWKMVEGAAGVISSGDGPDETAGIFISGDGPEEPGVPCEHCLKEVHHGIWVHLDCTHGARLAECFEECHPAKIRGPDLLDTKYLELFAWLFGIMNRLLEADCELEDEVAPGCTSQILTCASHIALSSSYQPNTLGYVNCSDEALTEMYSCFEDQEDCVWRSHIETITSKARRSLCLAEDRCLMNGNFFLIYSGCTSYKVSNVYDVDAIDDRPIMNIAPGTQFNTTTCGNLKCTSPEDYESPDTFDASFINILLG